MAKPLRSPSVMRNDRLARQNNLCAWCNDTLLGVLSEVDHDHRCCDFPSGKCCLICIRGVVHPECNKTIGRIEVLEREGYHVHLSAHERMYLDSAPYDRSPSEPV